jgi:hypothetical protein
MLSRTCRAFIAYLLIPTLLSLPALWFYYTGNSYGRFVMACLVALYGVITQCKDFLRMSRTQSLLRTNKFSNMLMWCFCLDDAD